MVLLSRAGHLQSEDYIWFSGQTDWLPAPSVPGLMPEQAAPRQLGFSEALQRNRTNGEAPRPIVLDIAPRRGTTSEMYVPHLARSLTRLSEGSALAAWKAARATHAVPLTATAPGRPIRMTGALPAAAVTSPGANAMSVAVAAAVPATATASAAIEPANVTAEHRPQSVAMEPATGPGFLQHVSSLLGAVRSKVEEVAAWAPARLQAATGQLHAFDWNHLVAALAQAFERMQVRTLDDLMDDARMRNVAHVVLDTLPWSARTCIVLAVGEAGMEGFVLRIRDWLRVQIPDGYRQQDIGPLVRQLLGSQAIAAHFQGLFADLKQRLLAALGTEPALLAAPVSGPGHRHVPAMAPPA
jgi:hypothetical protein